MAALAQERSAELRGLLDVVAREHHVNRALMTQELAFLDHLLRLSGLGDSGYDCRRRSLDHARALAARAPTAILDMEV